MFLKMGFCTRFVPKQTRQKISSFGHRLTQLWLSLHGVPILNSINTNLCQTFWRITPQRKTPRTYCEKSFLSKRQACNSFDFWFRLRDEWLDRVRSRTSGRGGLCLTLAIVTSFRVGWLSEIVGYCRIWRTIPVIPFAIYQQSSDVIESDMNIITYFTCEVYIVEFKSRKFR